MSYEKEEEINLMDLITWCLKHKKLFFITGIISIIIAVLYLKYTPLEYQVKATILIMGEKTGAGVLSELSTFEEMGFLQTNNTEVKSEIEILKSRPLFKNVVKNLNLQYQYYTKPKFLNQPVELYEESPISSTLVEDSLLLDKITFNITINSKTEFTIEEKENNFLKEGVFGQKISTKSGDIIIKPNAKYLEPFLGKQITLLIHPITDVVENYKSKISNNLTNDGNIISLSLNTQVRKKAQNIINELIKEYNHNAIKNKNKIYENTANFIKERLTIINSELSDIEHGVETFKTSNNIINVTTESELFLENSSKNKKEVLETNTQLGLVNFMNNYLKANEKGLLPVNLGFSEEAIIKMISKYNEIILKRDQVLKSTTLKNPIVISLSDKLNSIKLGLKQSLNNQKRGLKIKLKDLQNENAVMNTKIAALPKKEKELRDIVRQQEIKETLYLYLLQKREETAISLAATVANAKIIEEPYSPALPVKPKTIIVLLASLIATFIIPIIILVIMKIFDVKIKDKNEIQKNIDIPIVAEIPTTNTKDNFIISANDRSITAEAFRIFESNLKFLLSDFEEKSKTILVTSSAIGEGKSFTSINLSIVLSEPKKKVVLLGLDLRFPKISEYLNLDFSKGVTNYVRDKELTLKDITTRLDNIPNLDIINSGIIPPNPVEILKSKRFQKLITELKEQYDYIIIDTPPVNLVADALLLNDHVDLCMYVVRSHFSDKRLLPVAENLFKEKRFSNMTILLNGVTVPKKNYYNYGAIKPKTWWKPIKQPV